MLAWFLKECYISSTYLIQEPLFSWFGGILCQYIPDPGVGVKVFKECYISSYLIQELVSRFLRNVTLVHT